jgi:hypothetical protein
MKIENIVTSLEISKKLVEIGIYKKSFFYWDYENNSCYALKFITRHITTEFNSYAAFTASELLSLLPDSIIVFSKEHNEPLGNFRLGIIKVDDKKYVANYAEPVPDFSMLLKHEHDENLSNCLAKLLIGLIENGFLSVEQINKG